MRMCLRSWKPVLAVFICMMIPTVYAKPELYQIEMIVFEQSPDTQSTSPISHETWPHFMPVPLPPTAIRLFEGEAPIYAALPDEQRLLNVLEKRLSKSSQYHILWHKSWIQPLPRTESHPIVIETKKDESSASNILLQGTISVTQKHFQTVKLNLLLTQSKQNFHLTELRHIKGDGLQYFDHPKLGALLIVKAFEGDSDEEAATEEAKPSE